MELLLTSSYPASNRGVSARSSYDQVPRRIILYFAESFRAFIHVRKDQSVFVLNYKVVLSGIKVPVVSDTVFRTHTFNSVSV